MFKVLKHEAKRFDKVVIIVLLLYLFLTIFTYNFDDEALVLLENEEIMIMVFGINIYILINLIADNFNNHKLIYYPTNLSKLKILLGKLLTLMLYNFIALLVGVLVYNIRLFILYKNAYLTFFRMNLDNVGMALIEKSFREWLYPINYLLNLLYYDILIYALVILYHAIKKRYKTYLAIFAIIGALLTHGVMLYLVNKINSWSNVLDFNVLYHRINVITFSRYEINFLSLFCLIIYSFLMFILVIKISDYQEENQL